jgi:ribosomal protein L37E
MMLTFLYDEKKRTFIKCRRCGGNLYVEPMIYSARNEGIKQSISCLMCGEEHYIMREGHAKQLGEELPAKRGRRPSGKRILLEGL